MILLRNNKDATKSLLVGENENDDKVLSFIMSNHIMWGFYSLIHVTDKNKELPITKMILAKYPTATCIAQLSCPEGFVPKYETREI